MEIEGYKEIMMIIESLSERVKALERAARPMKTRLGPSSVIKNSSDNWADVKEGGEFQWSKL